MTCARCGCGVYRAEDQIVMTKVWHKCCFRCCNCNKKLDKCSAILFQGEIFCDRCHCMKLDDLETVSVSPMYKPCRVVSSPSCICVNEDNQQVRQKVPTLNYYKKYDIDIPPESKKSLTKIIKSCSCIPDKEKSYCFAFPIPREVANYYNRANMRRKFRHSTPKHFSQEQKYLSSPRNEEMGPCFMVRTISPPRKVRSPSHNHRISFEELPVRCCTKQQRAPPGFIPDHQNGTSPSRPRQECTCNLNRRHSPHKRKSSPPRRNPRCCCCCCHHEDHQHNSRRHSPIRRELSSDPDISDHRCYVSCPECPICSKYNNKSSKDHHYHHYSSDYHSHRDDSENVEDTCHRNHSVGPQCFCCPVHCKDLYKKQETSEITPKYCICGKLSPCDCKMSQIRAECTSLCVRCHRKVYAAERICIASGPFHTSCFSCYCCHKLLDVKNVSEHKGEIYCKNCYNSFMGNQYYGYGAAQYC